MRARQRVIGGRLERVALSKCVEMRVDRLHHEVAVAMVRRRPGRPRPSVTLLEDKSDGCRVPVKPSQQRAQRLGQLRVGGSDASQQPVVGPVVELADQGAGRDDRDVPVRRVASHGRDGVLADRSDEDVRSATEVHVERRQGAPRVRAARVVDADAHRVATQRHRRHAAAVADRCPPLNRLDSVLDRRPGQSQRPRLVAVEWQYHADVEHVTSADDASGQQRDDKQQRQGRACATPTSGFRCHFRDTLSYRIWRNLLPTAAVSQQNVVDGARSERLALFLISPTTQ